MALSTIQTPIALKPASPLRIPVALAVFCVALLSLLSVARADDASATLKHGVNLSNWFSDSTRQPLTENDFSIIKKAGFDHVRIAVNPEFWAFSLSEAATGRVLFDFSKIDDAVNFARDRGLSIIFDLAPGDGFMAQLEQDPRAAAGFIALWRHLAEHYKLYASNVVAFELLSQPLFNKDVGKYNLLITEVIAAIREVSPKNAIIVDVPKGAVIEGFDGLIPIKGDNIYYAFHYYEPYILTHQGLRAAPVYGRALRYFHNLPYPSRSVDGNKDYASGASDSIEAKKEITDYVMANWDAGHIAARVKLVAAWAAANHYPVICTEFGFVKNATDPAVRYRWIEDVRKSLDANNIGWDLWDYTDTFGITNLVGETMVDPRDHTVQLADPDTGSREIQPEAIKALFGN